MTDYEKIRLMMAIAKDAYKKREITIEVYINIIEEIEADFLNIQKKIEEKEIRELLNKYIANLP